MSGRHNLVWRGRAVLSKMGLWLQRACTMISERRRKETFEFLFIFISAYFMFLVYYLVMCLICTVVHVCQLFINNI